VSEDRWVRIGAQTYRERLAMAAMWATPVSFAAYLVGSLVSRPAMDAFGLAPAIILALLAALGAYLVAAAIQASRFPTLSVRPDAGRVRIRNTEFVPEDLRRASLLPVGRDDKRVLLLTLGPEKGPAAQLILRKGTRVLLPEGHRALLLDVVRRSGLQFPRNPDDPQNRFAKYNHPGSIDRDIAIAVLERIPEPGDPLPVSL
jgi:hypothetical protein